MWDHIPLITFGLSDPGVSLNRAAGNHCSRCMFIQAAWLLTSFCSLKSCFNSNVACFHWDLRVKGGKELDIAATAGREAGGLIVGKTKLVAVAYGSHYLPLWLKARVCPPASVTGLRPSHRPQLFLLVPVYHLIMCALLTIVVRPVCTCWEWGGRDRMREKEIDVKCEKSSRKHE